MSRKPLSTSFPATKRTRTQTRETGSYTPAAEQHRLSPPSDPAIGAVSMFHRWMERAVALLLHPRTPITESCSHGGTHTTPMDLASAFFWGTYVQAFVHQ